jgi:hypothetical protein
MQALQCQGLSLWVSKACRQCQACCWVSFQGPALQHITQHRDDAEERVQASMPLTSYRQHHSCYGHASKRLPVQALLTSKAKARLCTAATAHVNVSRDGTAGEEAGRTPELPVCKQVVEGGQSGPPQAPAAQHRA